MSDINQAAPVRREPWPSWKQTLIMLVGGLVLAVSGCFGFLFTLNFNGGANSSEVLNIAGAVGFGIGVLAFLVGIVMLLMRFMRFLLASGSRPSSPPSPPGPPTPPIPPLPPSHTS